MRVEFTVPVQVAIVNRASDSSWRIHCEACGAWCKGRADYEIDHVRAEGMRPIGEPPRKLTAADGQLLCLACHEAKTRADKGAIAEAKRREAYHWGLTKKRQRKKRERPAYRPGAGEPALMRRGFVPAGSHR
jgi:hypothetical protein